MPEISRFFGIVIRMYYSDHESPHFHAVYGDHEAIIAIETLALEGAAMRRPELHSDWDLRIGSGMNMVRIAAAVPLAGRRVRLTLTDGRIMERDLAPLLTGPVFEQIRGNDQEFAAMRVQDGTLIWSNGADLCPDVLIWGGLPPANPVTEAA